MVDVENMPFLFDSHSHLHFSAFEHDRDAVLSRMREKNIWTLTVGTTLANSEAGAQFAESLDGVWATAALHPEHLTSSFHDQSEGKVKESSLDIDRLLRVARMSSKIVAIGETGLDFHWIDSGLDRKTAEDCQAAAFEQHIAVAQKLDLPLVIHCRDAMERLIQILKTVKKSWPGLRGVAHSFSGTVEDAQKLIDLGLYIGINGIITFKPRKNDLPERSLSQIVANLPLDRLLVETDAPYLAPVPHRGERNEPSYVEDVARAIAVIKGLTINEIADVTTKNAKQLFNIVQ